MSKLNKRKVFWGWFKSNSIFLLLYTIVMAGMIVGIWMGDVKGDPFGGERSVATGVTVGASVIWIFVMIMAYVHWKKYWRFVKSNPSAYAELEGE